MSPTVQAMLDRLGLDAPPQRAERNATAAGKVAPATSSGSELGGRDGEAVAHANMLFGVTQLISLLQQGERLRPDKNFAHYNLVVSEDNKSWIDNGSMMAGDAVELVAKVLNESREKAATRVTEWFEACSSEDRELNAPAGLSENSDSFAETEFPVSCLPGLLEEMTCAVAEMESVPPVLATGALIGAASASLGRGIVIESKHDKFASGNLYILMEAESGSGKSGTCARAVAPIAAFERELFMQGEELRPQVTARLKTVERKQQALLRACESREAGDEEAEKQFAALEGERQTLQRKLTVPCLISGDATSERLAQLIEEHGAISSYSGEARGIISVLAGKYDDGQISDSIYLSGFTVEEGFRQNRVSRSDIWIERPWLSIMWQVQPDMFDKFWTVRSFVEGGLLPRFLSCRTGANVQFVSAERKVFPQTLADRYDRRLRELLAHYRAHVGAPFVVKVSQRAREIIIDYTNRTAQRRKSGEFSSFEYRFASRWGEIAWKLALVFHAVEHGANAHNTDVSEANARKAVAVVSWFSLQQVELLAELNKKTCDDQTIKALNLVTKYHRLTVRLVLKHTICKTPEDARKLLTGLVDQGVLEAHKHEGRGPATWYYCRPSNYQTGKR